MDLWAVHIKNSTRTPLLLRNSFPEKPMSWNLGRKATSSARVEDWGLCEIRVLRRPRLCTSSLVVRAMAKKNHENGDGTEDGDRSIPEGDGVKRNNSDGNRSNDTASNKSQRLDWREFRANLFAREQAEKAEPDAHSEGVKPHESKSLGLKWAHPIPVPETGCVLVATEKLDGVRTFERTVVLLLRSGTRHPQEGPFGVVINRPLHKKIKHMKPTNLDLATTFSDCSLHFGGPLEASMFLLKSGEKPKLPVFEEVIPGLCFGARNSLDEAAGLVKKGVLKPQDFRFFVGYAGWQLDQLREEIESDYWYVAACSSNLIGGCLSDSSSEGLWEEILQLMGGHYSELSRKPKQDM
ncbi:hypothetical protein I3760_03G010700 [Carya illinoinensis]|uniref:Uncharacterized protein n=1 Tax=Carya illinoinensis TaxID=32201 RepID=A0A8T1QVV2_CARIL|nr:UPF0301 protein BCG_0069-like [Carya illinoinensis]KAG2714114.1 hypothetical protein I3760_03G010700 [Carya illinoinensis]KAG6659200.1 hypothetical protein CIPAW_03G016900 [Carya illinoinensis]